MRRQHPAQLSITLCHRGWAMPQQSFLQPGEFHWTIGFPNCAHTPFLFLRFFLCVCVAPQLKNPPTVDFLYSGGAASHHERRTDLREEDCVYSDRSARIYELPPELQGLPNSARVLGDGHGLLQRTDGARPARILPESGVRTAHELLPPPV